MKEPTSSLRRRAGFSLIEMLVVLTLAAILAKVSVGRIHDLMIQQRVARAATVFQTNLEAAYAISARNRLPVRVSWDSASQQLRVTDRAGTTYYRRTSIGTTYGLSGSSVQLSRSPLEVYPNGLANDSLAVTITQGGFTKRVHMSRAGLVQIQ